MFVEASFLLWYRREIKPKFVPLKLLQKLTKYDAQVKSGEILDTLKKKKNHKSASTAPPWNTKNTPVVTTEVVERWSKKNNFCVSSRATMNEMEEEQSAEFIEAKT